MAAVSNSVAVSRPSFEHLDRAALVVTVVAGAVGDASSHRRSLADPTDGLSPRQSTNPPHVYSNLSTAHVHPNPNPRRCDPSRTRTGVLLLHCKTLAKLWACVPFVGSRKADSVDGGGVGGDLQRDVLADKRSKRGAAPEAQGPVGDVGGDRNL